MQSIPIFGSEVTQLTNSLSEGVLVVDHGGIVRFASDVAHRQFGAEAPHLVGRPVDQLVPEPHRATHRRHREAFASRLPRFGAARSELTGCRLDGSTIPLRITLAPLDTAVGPMTLAVVSLSPDPAKLAMPAPTRKDQMIQTLFGLSMQLDALCATRPERVDHAALHAVADHLHQVVRELITFE